VTGAAGPGERVKVLDLGELPAGTSRTVAAFGMEIALFNASGAVFAVAAQCPHAGGPLCHGKVGGTPLPSDPYEYRWGMEDRVLTCPWHGWQFDLESGESLFDPLVSVATYPVEIVDGSIYLSEH
jgi:nitrite reductase (NADH) small subunit